MTNKEDSMIAKHVVLKHLRRMVHGLRIAATAVIVVVIGTLIMAGPELLALDTGHGAYLWLYAVHTVALLYLVGWGFDPEVESS